ncbi:hypothetical protein [Kribbia dieselivorans]|uniref:hypothetical protein n=1 Tax=Kribbia dieselivorans TaxID=331526 RepID=UPI0008388820|nr:hypothetical protein [Kribbia dieselivorans]
MDAYGDTFQVAPERGACACPTHLTESLLATKVPFSTWFLDEEEPEDPVTVGDLIEMEAFEVRALTPDQPEDHPDLARGFQFEAWAGDEVSCHYDDDARLAFDAAVGRQPGIGAVDWEDREVLYITAPTMCEEGVMTAMAGALLDRRVRTRRLWGWLRRLSSRDD